MSGFVLHPEAYTGLDEIWEYIAGVSEAEPAAEIPKRSVRGISWLTLFA
jgi:hypothetical protein